MLDLAIIGGGPAGLTAGLYATRGGLKKVTMFEKGMPGGQITQSSEIENYPGQSKVVTGLELMESWPEQCKRFGLKHEMLEVLQVKKEKDTFLIKLSNGESTQAKSVLIATGSIPKSAGLKGEEEFFGRGVSTCATCDGFFYKDQEVAVIGGGDTAIEEALFLSNICKKVYIIHRRDKFSAAPHEVEKLENTDNIEKIMNASVEEITGDQSGVNGLNVYTTNKQIVLSVKGVFIFVGRKVLNESLKQDNGDFLCNVNSNGEVYVNLKMQTSVSGLYAAGDIRIDAPKQVVCAAGDGATAAIDIISYLS
jgi:thioredoxin reductase (NADPH)